MAGCNHFRSRGSPSNQGSCRIPKSLSGYCEHRKKKPLSETICINTGQCPGNSMGYRFPLQFFFWEQAFPAQRGYRAKRFFSASRSSCNPNFINLIGWKFTLMLQCASQEIGAMTTPPRIIQLLGSGNPKIRVPRSQK